MKNEEIAFSQKRNEASFGQVEKTQDRRDNQGGCPDEINTSLYTEWKTKMTLNSSVGKAKAMSPNSHASIYITGAASKR